MSERSRRLLEAAALLGRLAVGSVFLLSGFSKAVAAPQEFAFMIEAYQIVPPDFSMAMAYVMPWLELFIGAWVLIGFFRRPSAALACGMLSVFIVALLSAHFRDLPLGACGCFGNLGPHLKPWQASLLDTGLLLLSVAVYRDAGGRWSVDRWIEPPPEPLRKTR